MSMFRRLVVLAAAFGLASLPGCAVNRATATADETLRWEGIKTLHVKQLESEDGAPRS
jgi:hypothetical protein